MSAKHLALCVCSIAWLACSAQAAETNLVRNGNFADGTAGWSDTGVNDDKEVTVVDVQGKKALLLKRKKEGVAVNAVQYNLKFKPQTLYKLSVTGWGKAAAAVSLRPKNEKDDQFFELCKSWATSTAPLDISGTPVTNVLLLDSGLKSDSAFLNVRLGDGGPGEYYVSSVSLTEIASTKPEEKEIVIAHLGDSITITSYLPFGKRVDGLLNNMCEIAFPGKRIRNVNLGVDGEFIKGLLDSGRYDRAIKAQYSKFDVVIIRYGANDRKQYSLDEFHKLLGVLCDKLQQDYPGVTIVMGTGPYIHKSDSANKTEYGPFWQAARDFAKERKYALVDIYARFEKEASEATAVKPGDAHPSELGVKLVADEEFKILQPILKEKLKQTQP